MSSNEADNIDKLYKNYDILNDAKEKIAEVSVIYVWSRYRVTCLPHTLIHPNAQTHGIECCPYFGFNEKNAF